ncbi:hypothetical protein BD626DRAFT_85504 [Schizophyllum amplum]|uniref:Uncharacterized protein n=1 Tax=Schizophyllum amplum TaxID=97359 RepID=A0A550C983_9AGAR|nr:hypothetical protein BD626DRAFT_85504 [Auriculariopsis ampla]
MARTEQLSLLSAGACNAILPAEGTPASNIHTILTILSSPFFGCGSTDALLRSYARPNLWLMTLAPLRVESLYLHRDNLTRQSRQPALHLSIPTVFLLHERTALDIVTVMLAEIPEFSVHKNLMAYVALTFSA